MNDELTREQVVNYLDLMTNDGLSFYQRRMLRIILNHDASLRANRDHAIRMRIEERDSLMAACSALDKQVAYLRDLLLGSIPKAEHNKIVADTLRSLDVEHTNFEQQIASLTVRLAAMTIQRNNLVTERNDLDDTRQGLEAELSDAKQQRDKLHDVIAKQQVSIEHLSAQHTLQATRADQFQTTVTAQAEETNRLREPLEWFVNLGCGVSRYGGPCNEEYESALELGKQALVNKKETT